MCIEIVCREVSLGSVRVFYSILSSIHECSRFNIFFPKLFSLLGASSIEGRGAETKDGTTPPVTKD